MNLFSWRSTQFFPDAQSITLSQHQASQSVDINPASGMPMVDGIGGIDIAGNTYGFNNSIKENDSYEFDLDSPNDSSYEVDLSFGNTYSSSSFD